MAKEIQSWNPEDPQEWEATGKSIASRNLWMSIPSLLCGFAVWLYWGIITVQMLNLGFPYAKSELFSLAAIAGLSGATLTARGVSNLLKYWMGADGYKPFIAKLQQKEVKP